MIRKLQKCEYRGGVCFVVRQLSDGRVRVVTSDPRLIPHDSGWEQVDKVEWEKTVDKEEIQLLPEECSD